MEKEIKKLVELAKRIIREIDENGICREGYNYYAKSINHYKEMGGESRSVHFLDSNKNSILTYVSWCKIISINYDVDTTSLSELHDRVEKEWNEYITTIGEAEKQKVIAERQQRIKQLQEELELLTNKQ